MQKFIILLSLLFVLVGCNGEPEIKLEYPKTGDTYHWSNEEGGFKAIITIPEKDKFKSLDITPTPNKVIREGNEVSGLIPIKHGENTFTFKLTTEKGKTATTSVKVNREAKPDAPPLANFNYQNRQDIEDYRVEFDGGLSTDPNNDIVRYDWPVLIQSQQRYLLELQLFLHSD
jgi:hypothetical protein